MPHHVDGRRTTAVVMVGLLGLLPLAPQRARGQQADLSFLTTRAESSGYLETTRYDEAIGFLEVLAAQDPAIHLTEFGYSVEGRALPLVLYGDLASTDPAVVRADGRLRVFVQANIHAGEVCGKEAMLAMLRDLALTGRPAWADSVLLLVAPIYNADGNERVSLYNRPRQNGPLGGMGQRPNAQDLDLNRDHMKLASPEAHSLVALMNAYDPHVLVDLHTTNGTQHGYHITYAPPLHPNTHPAVVDLLRDEALPQITDSVRAATGWEMYYYGNLPFRAAAGRTGWYTFDHRPRFNNNYVGLRGRVAILSEAYAYAPFRERVLATRAFVEEIVDWSFRHGANVRAAIDAAESDPVSGTAQGVRATFAASEEPVDIILGTAEMVRHPYTGQPVLQMTEERRIESMTEYGTFVATETVTAPRRYLVPADLPRIRLLLDDHGIRYDTLDDTVPLEIEVFRIDSTRAAERPFQNVQEREVFGAWVGRSATLPAGTLSVPVNQPLGRLLVALLEPRSDDGAVDWAILDRELRDASEYPVMRQPAR